MSYKVRRKTKKILNQEVTNLAEHLAQTCLFEISNEVENEQALPLDNQLQLIHCKLSQGYHNITLQYSGKRTRYSRRTRPLQSRTLARKINVINYSHSSILSCKSREIKDQKGNTMPMGVNNHQQHWLEPVKNFSKEIKYNVAKFIIFDNRESRPQTSGDGMQTSKMHKSLYKNSFFRKKKDQRLAEDKDHKSALYLPRADKLMANRYQPLNSIIHSIYTNLRNQSCDNIQHRQNKKF